MTTLEFFVERCASNKTQYGKLLYDLELFTKRYTKDVLEKANNQIDSDKEVEEEEELKTEELITQLKEEKSKHTFVPELKTVNIEDIMCEQSVEISFLDDRDKWLNYIREDVKIFGMNTVYGSNERNEQVLKDLKQSGLSVSHELGIPIPMVTYVKINPSKLCTGFLKHPENLSYLESDSNVIITTDRRYSLRCTKNLIYMNTRAQMACIGVTDIIRIGKSIQLKIWDMVRDRTTAFCTVVCGGTLCSQQSVQFPYFCKDYSSSYEVIEDVWLAVKMNVNILIASTADLYEQFDKLHKTIECLENNNNDNENANENDDDCITYMLNGNVGCSQKQECMCETDLECIKSRQMKIYASVYVNKFDTMKFLFGIPCMVDIYEGFLMECYNTRCPDTMKLINYAMVKNVRDFMKLCFEKKKPIILAKNWLQKDFEIKELEKGRNSVAENKEERETFYDFFKGNLIEPRADILDLMEIEKRYVVEINCEDSLQKIIALVRSKVKIFVINLFDAPLEESEKIFLRIKMAELQVSHELNTLISHQIMFIISPRQSLTGRLCTNQTVYLEDDDKVTLTMNRKFSNKCTGKLIYICGISKLGCIKVHDIISIGATIEIRVLKIMFKHQSIFGCVIRNGTLTSHMPVNFINYCKSKYLTSSEEMEDIAFATKYEIDTISAYRADSAEYCNGLRETLNLLKCKHLKLYARIYLTELNEDKFELKLSSITNAYDGFLMQYNPIDDHNTTKKSSINFLQSIAMEFTDQCTANKKPILLLCNDVKRGLIGEAKSTMTLVKIPSSVQICHESIKNIWLGYFQGYDILPKKEIVEPLSCGNRKAIDISYKDSKETLMNLIRSEVSTFGIDLFYGHRELQESLLLRLKAAQLCVSFETNLPASVAVYVKLSPREPRVGRFLELHDDGIYLENGRQIIITTDRRFSVSCTSEVIYVSARFQLTCTQQNHIITIGNCVQARVDTIVRERQSVICTVTSGGYYKADMEVKLYSDCENQCRNYAEELEDLTFAMALGINVVVTRSIGNHDYFNHMTHILDVLIKSNLRVYTQIRLNDFDDDDNKDLLDWAANAYDGFLLEYNKTCSNSVIRLSTNIGKFMRKCFENKKPIIFAGDWSNVSSPIIDPCNHEHFFYYPDKYVLSRDHDCKFFAVCQAMFEKLSTENFRKTFIDKSLTGSDSLARGISSASFDLRTGAIIVCSSSGRMATKIAHFRPKTPIILVSNMNSVADHVLMCHNIWFIHFAKFFDDASSHDEYVFEQLLVGLDYAQKKTFIRDGHKVLLVFRKLCDTGIPDNYLCFKFIQRNYVRDLRSIFYK